VAGAGDEPAKAVWVFEKGEATMEVEVTRLDEAARARLRQKYEAEGWRRVERPAPPERAPAGGVDEDTLKDLEDLLRHAGRLPDGFVPHALRDRLGPSGPPGDVVGFQRMLRPVGRMILRYLEAKDRARSSRGS
jgi:hypothetical protein